MTALFRTGNVEDKLYSQWSHWNAKVIRMTAPLLTGDVEDKLQRLQWRPGQSSWWPFHFCGYISFAFSHWNVKLVISYILLPLAVDYHSYILEVDHLWFEDWWLIAVKWAKAKLMMTSSNEKIFRVTGHLCGEFTSPRWIPHTKTSDVELWCFLWSAPE